MFRLLALVCLTAVFAFPVVFAQDEPNAVRIKATPEILSLFEESLQSLSQAETNPRIGMLFQLLGFTMSLDDKAPAQKIVDVVLELAPTIELEELRNQLYAGIANALSDLEKYPEAVAALNRIGTPADRSKGQLNLAMSVITKLENDKIFKLENVEALKAFDAVALIRQSIGGAGEAQDFFLEAVARVYLGRELARQGKQEEAAAAFAEAMKVTQKIEEAEDRERFVPVLLESQVEYGQNAGAMAMLQTVSPETKQMSIAGVVPILIQREKYDIAETLIKTLSPGNIKDELLGSFVMAAIKTITDEKVGELAALVSSDEIKERFLQIITKQLQTNGRGDVAIQVGKRLTDPVLAEMSLFIGKVETLVEAKKFTEAVRFVDESKEEESIRQHLKRQILMMQHRETSDESAAGQIEASFTSNEKIAVAELREEAKRAVEVADLMERTDTLLEIFQGQSRFLDFAGARQTLKLIAEQLDKGTDRTQLIRDRLLLARLQVELRDNEGAKANLTKLTQTLSAVKDLSELKDLVPELPSAPGGEPVIDEPVIRNHLFQIYFMIATLSAKANAPTESQSAFAKAKELAKAEPDAVLKAEKLLILTQFLAENQ